MAKVELVGMKQPTLYRAIIEIPIDDGVEWANMSTLLKAGTTLSFYTQGLPYPKLLEALQNSIDGLELFHKSGEIKDVPADCVSCGCRNRKKREADLYSFKPRFTQHWAKYPEHVTFLSETEAKKSLDQFVNSVKKIIVKLDGVEDKSTTTYEYEDEDRL